MKKKQQKKQKEWIVENLFVKFKPNNTEFFYVFKEKEAASGTYRNNKTDVKYIIYHPKRKKQVTETKNQVC